MRLKYLPEFQEKRPQAGMLAILFKQCGPEDYAGMTGKPAYPG
jgi:hypothetical protein